MRINKIFWVVAGLFVLLLFSFEEPKLKKRITDKEFKYEFYVTDKASQIKSERIYYWFKGGAIHNAESGISGELLDDAFDKFYLNNQLAEQGTFSRGLKIRTWKTWYANGTLESSQYWDEGRRNGSYKHYSDAGMLIEKGRYRANKKQGQWIDYRNNDTIIFLRGERVIPKIKEAIPANETDQSVKKNTFFKRLFAKKDTTETAEKSKNTKGFQEDKTIVKEPRKKGKVNQPVNKPQTELKKKGFFERLFSKKEKSNGQGA